ncbi:MAG: flagellar M-ring protein FliF [Rhodobacteraceae bacterium]|nr:flagellar M-ring protein FliF [Paracoccaceae bacterium]
MAAGIEKQKLIGMTSMWTTLDPRKKIIFVLAAVAALVATLGLVRVATTPSLSLLYAGLDPSIAGEVITSLDQRGITYQVRGNAIYVDAGSRDQARLSLASEGLPGSGIAGYELLDNLSGFGTTSQMFDAAYWRAKEGELARTLVSSAQVRSARVHIASGTNRPFERNSRPTASVTIVANNGSLPPAFADSARFLVASAVNGLSPDAVTVIDGDSGVVLTAAESGGVIIGSDGLDARAAAMRSNIERLLAARVGEGNAVVEVMVDAETKSQTVTERILDPESKVAISSETQSETDNSKGSGAQGVTVASNLPDGDAGGSSEESRNQARNSEIINYDVSETVRETVSAPGEIRKISVAVLVNDIVTLENGVETFTPRSEEELAALSQLVKSTIGFDEARGDVVTIESMQMARPPEVGTFVDTSPGFLGNNMMSLIQLGVLSVVVLALGLFVIKPLLSSQPSLPPLAPEDALAEAVSAQAQGLLSAPDSAEQLAIGHSAPSAADLLRTAISERSTETNRLLQNWIDTAGETEETPA